MAKAQRKANSKLKRRQHQFDMTMGSKKKDTSGYKAPGSLNRKKSGGKR